MKIVIQRVNNACVKVDNRITGQIGKGLLIFLGVDASDEEKNLPVFVNKIVKMRIFSDENDKINLSVNDIGGSLLVVSQFTLCADIIHGNRPSFTNAMPPTQAEAMYEKFMALCKEQVPIVEHGEFGADMKVDIENDGPFTIILDNSLIKHL